MKVFVQKIRLEKNISQSELARKSGVSKAHISYIESGQKNPTLMTLCKIAQAMDVPCCCLFSCEDYCEKEKERCR